MNEERQAVDALLSAQDALGETLEFVRMQTFRPELKWFDYLSLKRFARKAIQPVGIGPTALNASKAITASRLAEAELGRLAEFVPSDDVTRPALVAATWPDRLKADDLNFDEVAIEIIDVHARLVPLRKRADLGRPILES